MKSFAMRVRGLAKEWREAILGICAEVLLTVAIMAACLFVCLFWWGIAQ